jgi:sulfane dehydrogenase subunit SoxC
MAGVAATAMVGSTRAEPLRSARAPGRNLTPLSERAPGEHPSRQIVERLGGISTTPLQHLHGVITPSDLHFSRHHSGIPQIDAADHRLLLHGLVDRPLTFSLEELARFPACSRVCFVECSGNGVGAFRGGSPHATVAELDGATSNSEWTGVPLATLLREAGVKPAAKWFLAQSMDAGLYSRSIPIGKAWDDALVAYAQNGEPLRAEQGYPLRLLLPGFEGSANVKWLRRIELSDAPFMTREETARYSDLLPNGKIRVFAFEMDAKSILTSPTFPAVLSPGWWELRGLAWSGRGRIARVDVSTDGGASWVGARLDEPVLPKAHTRFRHLWKWDGRSTVLMSRATDETGYVQPRWEQLRAVRVPGNDYHCNSIRAWKVETDGRVHFLPGV